MELPIKKKLLDIYKKLTAFDEDRKSYLDIIGGLIFSIFISIIPASIYAVLLVSKDENAPLFFVWNRFVISLIISTIIIYLIRFFIKGFARKFSIVFLSILFIWGLFIYTKSTIARVFCVSQNGNWVQENPFDNAKYGTLKNVCSISNNDFQKIKNKSFMYSITKFKIKD